MQYLNISLEGSARTWLQNRHRVATDPGRNLSMTLRRISAQHARGQPRVKNFSHANRKKGECLRSYIQQWSAVKNSAVDVSDESAIRSFKEGVRRKELKAEFGRQKPKTIGEMMEIANRWVDREESLRNDRARSPKDDGDPFFPPTFQ